MLLLKVAHKIVKSNLLVKVALRITVAKLKGLTGGFAICRQQIIWHCRWGWRAERQIGVGLLESVAALGWGGALTLSLGCRQKSTEAADVLAQLHGVDGEAARLRGDIQHGCGPRALGRGLV